MSRPQVVVIADDLTGAMDVAGPFASGGQATLVVASPERCEPERLEDHPVVSINAGSRHLPAAEAARRVRALAERLVPRNAPVVLKKIDSTLRGHVVEETLAMLDVVHRPLVVVAPAFPSQGRTLLDGIVHVDGVPLARTSFAHDALSPPPLAPLDSVFRRAGEDLVVARVSAGCNLPAPSDRPTLLVVDAETEADLDRVVASLRHRLASCLLVGSAGIARALTRMISGSCAPVDVPRGASRVLVVVGSRAPQTAAQVEALARFRDVRIVPAPNGEVPAAAAGWRESVVVLRAVPGADGREGDPTRVCATLAAHAARLVNRLAVDALVLTGGDTAIAVLEALEQPAFEVAGDLVPGIPHGRVTVGERELRVLTKAGGFGTCDTLVRLIECLVGRLVCTADATPRPPEST